MCLPHTSNEEPSLQPFPERERWWCSWALSASCHFSSITTPAFSTTMLSPNGNSNHHHHRHYQTFDCNPFLRLKMQPSILTGTTLFNFSLPWNHQSVPQHLSHSLSFFYLLNFTFLFFSCYGYESVQSKASYNSASDWMSLSGPSFSQHLKHPTCLS